MKKFVKGLLISAAVFLTAGVILACIGGIGGGAKGELSSDQYGNAGILHEVTKRLQWLPAIGILDGDESGFVIQRNDVQYDKKHDVVYGSFTDDSIRSTDIWNLDIEVGDGQLYIVEGDAFELKKEGDLGCQYYVKDNTFYLRQKGVIGNGHISLTLTIPKDSQFDEVGIMLGAGELVTKGTLLAKELDVEIGAGTANLGKVETGDFSAEIGAGELVIDTLNTKNCEAMVSMGSITVESGIVSGEMDAEVDMGSMEFFLSDAYENHSYEIDCAMGEISIGNAEGMKSYSGLSSEIQLTGKNAGNSNYDLTCNMGSIYLSFENK